MNSEYFTSKLFLIIGAYFSTISTILVYNPIFKAGSSSLSIPNSILLLSLKSLYIIKK